MGQNWCKWQYKRLEGAGPHQVYAGPCTYGGVIVQTGVPAEVRVYDQAVGAPDSLRELPGVFASSYDGFVDCPIAADLGLMVTITGAGAIAWVLYDPV